MTREMRHLLKQVRWLCEHVETPVALDADGNSIEGARVRYAAHLTYGLRIIESRLNEAVSAMSAADRKELESIT